MDEFVCASSSARVQLSLPSKGRSFLTGGTVFWLCATVDYRSKCPLAIRGVFPFCPFVVLLLALVLILFFSFLFFFSTLHFPFLFFHEIFRTLIGVTVHGDSRCSPKDRLHSKCRNRHQPQGRMLEHSAYEIQSAFPARVQTGHGFQERDKKQIPLIANINSSRRSNRFEITSICHVS